MGETTFENAKVGDKVYSNLYYCREEEDTNGLIVDINPMNYYSVVVDFGKQVNSFNFSGNYYSYPGIPAGQVLFWSKPKFEVPTRPKS
jgi:hypothetical protein